MKKIFTAISIILLMSLAFSHDHENMPPRRKNAVPYHGRRLPAEPESFFINRISEKIDYYGTVILEIHFSIPIDPRSVSMDEILINRKKIAPVSKFGYNKAGNVLRIRIDDKEYLNLEDDFFSIEFYGLHSFDGQPLEMGIFKNIPINDSVFFFSDIHPCPKTPPPAYKEPPRPQAPPAPKTPPKMEESDSYNQNIPKAPPKKGEENER